MLKELLSHLSILPISKPQKVSGFSLLSGKQIWGNKALHVMKSYGTKAGVTDLAVLLGACATETGYYTPDLDHTCSAWTTDVDRKGNLFVTYAGADGHADVRQRDIAVRPALPPWETEKITPTIAHKVINGIDIVLYGEYPQTVADPKTSDELEKLLIANSLRTTGKVYIFDVAGSSLYDTPFLGERNREYEYNGQKYVRILGRPADKYSRLQDGQNVGRFSYWVQVEPIEWLQDPSGLWVSRKCLFAGVQFDTKEKSNGHFENTFMKHYLDTYFSKEIEPSESAIKKQEKVIDAIKRKLSKIDDLEQVKKIVTAARSPERTEQLARITRIRLARSILSSAAQQAQKADDKEALNEIIEIARPYAARNQAVWDKFYRKQAARRARLERE